MSINPKSDNLESQELMENQDMPIVSHSEADGPGPEPLHRRLEQFWDHVLQQFSDQFPCKNGTPSDPAPQGGSEDARGSLDLFGDASK